MLIPPRDSTFFENYRSPPSKREEVPLRWHLIKYDHGIEERTPIHVGVKETPTLLLLYYIYEYFYKPPYFLTHT